MFKYIRKIANEVNQSLEAGTDELVKAADSLSSISERHKRMREIATEVGSLVIDACDSLDKAEISTCVSKQLLFETLGLLRSVDSGRVSSLSVRAVEADAALQETPGKLHYHGPFIRQNFTPAFFSETQEAFQRFGERIAQAATAIEEAKGHQVAAVEACQQSLENL